jgi:hypothetical protein
VTRGIGLIFALISLVVTGVLFMQQSKSQGPTSAAATHAEAQAVATAALAGFQPVDQILQVDFAQTGTYVGAQLPAGSGITVVRPTGASYCLQMDVDGTLMHENGPGGTPAPGAC